MHTRVDQVSDRIYRISTCIPEAAPGGFTFNQFLVDAEEPLLYHTGMRHLFPLVKEAVERVMLLEQETGTLLLGDLCTQFGDGPAVTDEDLLDAAIAAEDLFRQTSLGPAV